MIIVEDRFEEMFDVLPSMSNKHVCDKESFKPTFGAGDDKELMSFLIKHKGESIYPLIWLVQPYIENHSKVKVNLNRISIILAVETNTSMLNRERMKTTYNQVLIPLYDNIIELFNKSNTFNFKEDHDVVKYPYYSNEKLPGNRETLKSSEMNKTISPWDAMKITISGSFNNNCFSKNIKFRNNVK